MGEINRAKGAFLIHRLSFIVSELEMGLLDFIGHKLQEWSVNKLANNQSPTAIEALAEKVADTGSPLGPRPLEITLDILGAVNDQACIDKISEVWARTRNLELENLLVKRKWVAAEPLQIKILTALKTWQVDN